MPGGYEINEYQLPLDFTEEERERFNNVGFSDEFKRQILTQKEGGWGMVGTWKVTNRTKDGVAYTKIPVNESNMVDVGECYTGRIIDRLAAYEDSGLSPDEVQELAQAKADGRLVVLPETGIGDLSDGYHTFNELYHHRAILFSVICNEHPDISWKSKLHHDGTMFDGMFIVGINTPEGQATYHYDINPYWDMFRVRELEKAPEWDGHTSEQAIERIAGLTREEAESIATLIGWHL